MKTNEFNSVFASLIVDFIEYKRAAGYKYVTEVAYLKKFDELCCTMDVQFSAKGQLYQAVILVPEHFGI